MKKILQAALAAQPIALALALVAGCSTSDDTASEMSTFTLALTDAASDELASFCVDIESIRLTRAGGGEVGVLPAGIRVDLVTLTDVSQILNVVTVPAGLYSMAEITFDFTNAEAWLIGESTPATLSDSDGTMLTGTVSLPVNVGGSISAIANRNRVLELDFDLNQSVQVDVGGNEVFVEPSIVLRVDRSDPKELVVAGEVTSVDTSVNEIAVELQTLAGQRVTDIVVGVDAATVYQLNGVASVGLTGLQGVDTLGQDTWIQLYGAVDVSAGRIDATYVEAGTGTYNGGSDIIQGHIVQRVGGAGADATLTVLGHSNDSTHTSFLFNTLFTVNTDFATTAVTFRGTTAALDADALNIGQRVRIFGDLSGTTLDATGAASGVVRMQPTRVMGYSLAAPSGGTFDVDVSRVDLRDQTSFTWGDGGVSPPDPDAVSISSGGLTSGLGIGVNTPVEVRGYFSAVGDSAEDFIAVSVVNRENSPSLLVIADRASGMTLAPTIAADLSLALSGALGVGEVAVVDQGFVGATPLPMGTALSLQGSGGFGIYLIKQRSTQQASLNLNFNAFLTALSTGIGQGGDIFNVVALGEYNSGSNSMESGLLIVVLD